jgi:hypothetical protein
MWHAGGNVAPYLYHQNRKSGCGDTYNWALSHTTHATFSRLYLLDILPDFSLPFEHNEVGIKQSAAKPKVISKKVGVLYFDLKGRAVLKSRRERSRAPLPLAN